MRLHAVLLFAVVFVALATPASSQRIGIFPDPLGSGSCIDADQGQFLSLYIVVSGTFGDAEPISAVRFKTFQPWCGVHVFEWEPVFPLTYIGPEETTIYFESCQPLPVHVLTVQAVGLHKTDCCLLTIEPVSATDCNGNTVPLAAVPYTLIDTLCTLIPPSNPYPADGASGVPRDVVLTWNEMQGPNFCSDVKWHSVTFGTTPNSTFNTGFSGDTFWDPPGLLQENTTYYWRVTGLRNGTVSSPLWSFSTGAPVAVEQSTWGGIKALYR